MTDTGADMRTITLEKGLATFLSALTGKNRSAATIRAYQPISLSLSRFSTLITCRYIPRQRLRKLM